MVVVVVAVAVAAVVAAAAAVVVVVECYCFLKRIIDVGAVKVADVSRGLFCIYIKNGRFV